MDKAHDMSDMWADCTCVRFAEVRLLLLTRDTPENITLALHDVCLACLQVCAHTHTHTHTHYPLQVVRSKAQAAIDHANREFQQSKTMLGSKISLMVRGLVCSLSRLEKKACLLIVSLFICRNACTCIVGI